MISDVRTWRLTAAVLVWLSAAAAFGQERAADKAEVRLVVQAGQPYSSAYLGIAEAFSPDGKRILTGGQDGTVRLWDVRTSKELRALRAHANPIHVVAFSGDGRRFLTGGNDGLVRLWDARTGTELLKLVFRNIKRPVSSVAFSPDDKYLLTTNCDQGARVWDAQSGQEILLLKGRIGQAVFAPDGKSILTDSLDARPIVWDARSGAELLTLKGHTGAVSAVAFAPDGKRLLSGGRDQTARLWDAETGKELLALADDEEVSSVAFSPDGKRLLTNTRNGPTRLWDARSGQRLLSLEIRFPGVTFAPDGKSILSGGSTPRLWDAETGKELRAFRGCADIVRTLAFTPDGRRILIGSFDRLGTADFHSHVRLWDSRTGRELVTLKGRSLLTGAAISPDGRHVLTVHLATGTQVWDAQTGKELLALKGHAVGVFSPDGKKILRSGLRDTRTGEVSLLLCDTETGAELLTLKGHTGGVTAVAFSPDGKRVLSGSADQTARLWDAQTGKELRALTGHTSSVSSVAFAPDGERLLTGSRNTARLWDAETGEELRATRNSIWGSEGVVAFAPDGKLFLTGGAYGARLWNADTGAARFPLTGHTGALAAAAFSPDGKFILTGSGDHTARLWDVRNGKELCQLVSFHDGNWAVVDTAGRYDASNGGDVEGLHWVVGDEPIALKQLKERYYDPGLLAKHLGFNKEPLRPVAAFKDVKLFPTLAVTQADAKKPLLDVALTNRGGGIGKVVVLVNGKELTADARPRGADPDAAKLELKLDLSADPRLVPGQKNTVEVVAFNAEGYLSSRGLVREFDGPGTMTVARPHLYAVVAGVSKYRGDKLDLRFAAKDAEDFATALRLAAARLFGADKVHLTLLTATEARPDRANLVKALEALKATKPGDLVVVYLAGHGVTHGGQDGDWHYLTADAMSADLADPEVRQAVSLSSAELTDLLKAAPAQKQVLILDTCHSGRVVERLTDRRDVPGSQVRALERVKDRTGMHVLAGCAADAVSYEASKYGQGLLTYSLLLGMRGAKLREGEYVDIVDLFGYAADRVPELARDIGGVQRPTVASPRGSSFDIGRLTTADRAKVPLQSVKPVVFRSSFQEEKRARDGLGLTKAVNERLREASAVVRGAKMVFVDAEDFPGAVQVAGRYKIDGGNATISVSLYEGEKERATFTVEGPAGKPDDLAGKIVVEVEKRLAAYSIK